MDHVALVSGASPKTDSERPFLQTWWAIEGLDRLRVVVSPPATVGENLAVDEEETRTAAATGQATLRLWWGGRPTVVVGRSEHLERAVNLDACRRLGVEVLRRASGGGTVLQAPGVLNYSLTAPRPAQIDIAGVFAFGSDLLIGALARLGVSAGARGISDVTVGGRKISGNAQARKWGGVLLHGTLLCDLDIDLIEACLPHPPREPEYRRHRGHRDFLTTLRALGVNASPRDIEDSIMASASDLVAFVAAAGTGSASHAT